MARYDAEGLQLVRDYLQHADNDLLHEDPSHEVRQARIAIGYALSNLSVADLWSTGTDELELSRDDLFQVLNWLVRLPLSWSIDHAIDWVKRAIDELNILDVK